jgi:hypothetical protein
MSTMIAQPARLPHPHPGPHPDAAARKRRDRLARVTAADLESALAFLGAIDPEALEIALTAAAPPADETPEDEEPIPVCRQCGAPVGIFLAHGLRWQHFRGQDSASGTQKIYHPGHPAEVGWLLPGEDPEEL